MCQPRFFFWCLLDVEGEHRGHGVGPGLLALYEDVGIDDQCARLSQLGEMVLDLVDLVLTPRRNLARFWASPLTGAFGSFLMLDTGRLERRICHDGRTPAGTATARKKSRPAAS